MGQLMDGLRNLIPASVRNTLKNWVYGKSIEESNLVLKLFRQLDLNGCMIDVGAHHGATLEPFSRAGWRVYAFEPDPENRAILEQHIKRSGLKNVIVDERALGDRPGELSFFKSDVSKGISSLLDFHESHTAIGKVKVTTLNDFLRSQGIHKIDFLKTDAEGYDLKILQGIDLDTYQPEVILSEFEDAKTTKLDYTVHDTAAYLHQHQYRILFSEWYPIRQYGTRHQWKRFTTDMEQLDPKAWGNIIAVRPAHFDRLCQLSKKF